MSTELSKEELSKLVDDELCQMIKDNPAQMVSHLLIQMGRMCVEANAATMDIKQQSDFDGQRYEVKAKITLKKIKK